MKSFWFIYSRGSMRISYIPPLSPGIHGPEEITYPPSEEENWLQKSIIEIVRV